MAQRIMNQDSYLKKKKLMVPDFNKETPEKMNISRLRESEMKFFDQKIKNRKLPKLIKSPSVSNASFTH